MKEMNVNHLLQFLILYFSYQVGGKQMTTKKKVTKRKNRRRDQIIMRKKISLVMQITGIVLTIIGFVCLLGAAGNADYLAEIGSPSKEWIKSFLLASGAIVVGAALIDIPKRIFHMTMFKW